MFHHLTTGGERGGEGEKEGRGEGEDAKCYLRGRALSNFHTGISTKNKAQLEQKHGQLGPTTANGNTRLHLQFSSSACVKPGYLVLSHTFKDSGLVPTALKLASHRVCLCSDTETGYCAKCVTMLMLLRPYLHTQAFSTADYLLWDHISALVLPDKVTSCKSVIRLFTKSNKESRFMHKSSHAEFKRRTQM